MTISDFVANPAFLRAIVVGAFGGVGLALTATFSRRGPAIFPTYAALLAALALLLARYPTVPYAERFAAAFAGFTIASLAHYVVTCIHADAARRRLGMVAGIPFLGHAWRLALLAGLGMVVSAGVAYVAA